jgi:c(7)-type cytochrome triheme protein
MQNGPGRTKRRCPFLAFICVAFFVPVSVSGQVDLPQPPAANPSDYGKVILDNHASASPGPVVFDHWLHRARFTCRLCHVDIGFAMQAKATGISDTTIRQGFHCGACHDGKRLFEGKPIFAACSDDTKGKDCDRCHSLGKLGVRKSDYSTFTAHLPKDTFYGIDWIAAEKQGKIKPMDFLEGISVKSAPMQARKDFSIKAGLSWVHPIVFSHEKHTIWNGCELCHPEIFPTARKEAVEFSMFQNIEGRYCGACHGKVAFPLNHCSACHPEAPIWVP